MKHTWMDRWPSALMPGALLQMVPRSSLQYQHGDDPDMAGSCVAGGEQLPIINLATLRGFIESSRLMTLTSRRGMTCQRF